MDQDNKPATELSPKNTEIISFFEKDAGFVFVFKKTEKLASAVYMITGLFTDSEPMKWTLRKKVADLLSFIVSYKDVPESSLLDFVYNTKSRVLELVSLLEISFRGGLVSEMNFAILKREFLNLIETLDSTELASKESVRETISNTFFDVPRGLQIQNSTRDGYMKRPVSYGQKDTNSPAIKDEFKRSNRQNIILALLKKKKELTIKDIALVIKDCSEKTIQRELISFISAGVLKRTGERRWSKYSLI